MKSRDLVESYLAVPLFFEDEDTWRVLGNVNRNKVPLEFLRGHFENPETLSAAVAVAGQGREPENQEADIAEALSGL